MGLLEKGVNRAQASKMFDTIEEAQYYQAKYGGTNLSKNREEEITRRDYFDEDGDEVVFSIKKRN